MAENYRLLEDLLDKGFIESHEGSSFEHIKTLYPTRKLRFYIEAFARSLVYIEMIRNDSFIEYGSKPRVFGATLAEDFCEALKFIRYVKEQEEMQYRFARDGVEKLERFRRVVGNEPVSWTLLKSVAKFVMSVYARERKVVSKDDGVAMLDEFEQTKSSILGACRRDRICPRSFDKKLEMTLAE
jgi:hypothetical protein